MKKQSYKPYNKSKKHITNPNFKEKKNISKSIKDKSNKEKAASIKGNTIKSKFQKNTKTNFPKSQNYKNKKSSKSKLLTKPKFELPIGLKKFSSTKNLRGKNFTENKNIRKIKQYSNNNSKKENKNISFSKPKNNPIKEILEDLYKNNLILTCYKDNPKGWILKSGNWSPFYIQLRKLVEYPKLLKKIAYALSEIIKNHLPKTDLLLGLAMTGIPIATALSLKSNIPMAFTRQVKSNQNTNVKKYGEHKAIEGILKNKKNVLLIDDVVSSGLSKHEALNIIEYEKEANNLKGLKVENCLVIINRKPIEKKDSNINNRKSANITYYSLIDLNSSSIKYLKKIMKDSEYKLISHYLKDSEYFQDIKIQKALFNKITNNTIK